jgi:hypothetical protein
MATGAAVPHRTCSLAVEKASQNGPTADHSALVRCLLAGDMFAISWTRDKTYLFTVLCGVLLAITLMSVLSRLRCEVRNRTHVRHP